jgi:hypothetical protein
VLMSIITSASLRLLPGMETFIAMAVYLSARRAAAAR